MKANTNSIHARLYDFTYTSELPKNLCPYFWKLLAAVLLFIPNFICQLPMLIWEAFDSSNKELCGERREFGAIIYFILGILSLYLWSTWHLLKALFHAYSYKHEVANGAALANCIIIGIILIFMFLRWKDNRAENNKSNIIVEFVKAKYGKYCPTIEWEEESNIK